MKWGLNFFWCDTNDANCVLYDLTHVLAEQRAGVPVEIQFADSVDARYWAIMATFAAPEEPRTVEVTWFQPVNQRPAQRFFRVTEKMTTGRTMPGHESVGVRGVLTEARVLGAMVWSTPIMKVTMPIKAAVPKAAVPRKAWWQR